jgi:hypothetical protein
MSGLGFVFAFWSFNESRDGQTDSFGPPGFGLSDDFFLSIVLLLDLACTGPSRSSSFASEIGREPAFEDFLERIFFFIGLICSSAVVVELEESSLEEE